MTAVPLGHAAGLGAHNGGVAEQHQGVFRYHVTYVSRVKLTITQPRTSAPRVSPDPYLPLYPKLLTSPSGPKPSVTPYFCTELYPHLRPAP